MNEAVLFVADSGRQAAGQARYARMPMIVVDRFADEDTRASAWRTHRMERNDSSEAPEWADRYGKTLRRLSFMAGGGLESSMDMIDDLSARGEWLGSPPSAWHTTGDPFRLRHILRSIGVAMPPISRAPQRGDWLAKRPDSRGGLYVRDHAGGAPDPGWYLQRRVRGQSWSVIFLADGRQACCMGFNRLLPSPFGNGDYRYAGAIAGCDRRLPAAIRIQVVAILDGLVRRLDLRGVCGMDFIVDATGKWFVLEVNPRWVATAALYGKAVFAAHVNACRGQLPADWPASAGTRAMMVYYAARNGTIGTLPHWCSDRPAPGARIIAGAPLCTLSAQASTMSAAWKLLRERAAQIDACVRDEAQRHQGLYTGVHGQTRTIIIPDRPARPAGRRISV